MLRTKTRLTGDETSTDFPSPALFTLPESENAAMFIRFGTVNE